MPEYRFHHVHLTSPDPLKTAEYYEKMLGARRTGVEKTPSGDMVLLELGGSAIYIVPPRKQPLIPSAAGNACGIEHVGLKTDNLVQSVAKLKNKGAIFARDIMEPKPGLKTCFLVAPDNVLIELMEGG